MPKLTVMIIACIIIQGCSSWKILLSSKIEPSDQKSQNIELTFISSKIEAYKNPLIPRQISESCDPESHRDFSDEEKHKMRLLAGEFAVGAGSAIYTLASNAIVSKIDEIRTRSSATYSAQANIKTSLLRKSKCIILTRYADISNPELKIIAQIVPFGGTPAYKDPKGAVVAAVPEEGFQLAPLLISSTKSVALTKCDNCPTQKSKQQGAINISIALAELVVREETLKSIGETSFTVNDISVGDDPASIKTKAFPIDHWGNGAITGKPVPYASDDKWVNISVGITETGAFSGDNSKAKAELTAITEALSPAVSTWLKERFPSNAQ